jgi:hypothetical protein
MNVDSWCARLYLEIQRFRYRLPLLADWLKQTAQSPQTYPDIKQQASCTRFGLGEKTACRNRQSIAPLGQMATNTALFTASEG